ncbi:MAG: outer membrane lipoprotein-sorting protein [Bacteroidales bacterium]|mgnify:CR=1 FL=1|nr:outer membrane lipoprotein-sorting protein [Bacteroidales bacterium]
MKKAFLTLAAILTAFSLNAQNLSGRDIIKKVKDNPNGETRYAKLDLVLEKSNGSKRERKVESWAMDIGEDTKTMMFFTYPGDVKGTGFLTWNYDEIGKDDDKWLYMPALKKTRRISGSSSKTDYFMGTDFTYDDMGDRNVDEDEHKLLREENLEGFDCYVVESVPKDKREIYSKKISWIRKDCFMGIKVEFYDKLGKLHRVLNVSDIKKIQGYWTRSKMVMENVQTKHKTILTFSDMKYDLKIDQEMFNVTKLEKGL